MITMQSEQPASVAAIPRPPCFSSAARRPRSHAIPDKSAGATPNREAKDSFGREAELIRRARLGDAQAWEQLVRGNAGWILNTCTRWVGCRAKAEDLAQDVFIRVFLTLHSFRDEMGGFRGWLSRITRNMLIDDYRKNSRDRSRGSFIDVDKCLESAMDPPGTSGVNPDFDIEREERIAALHSALPLLAGELREAVTLRDLKGLSYRKIARLLGAPVGTVKSRVNRGRLELARLIRQRMAMMPGTSRRAYRVI